MKIKKTSPNPVLLIILLIFLLFGCTTAIRSETAAVEEKTPTPITSNQKLRIRLLTTSDWTIFNLISGATWVTKELISTSPEATTAKIEQNQFTLDQPIDSAEAGKGVEMTVELLLSPLATENELVFEIERGDIGYTQVEFFGFSGTNWEVMKTVQWAGKSGDGVNLYSVEIPFAELIEIAPTTIVDSQQEDTSKIDNSKNIQGTEEYPWWNDSVFYEIFVRSFYDSDGDGIGDFNGIVEKMDYLNDGNPNISTDLGITGIWLMPINPSPSYHGYSVTDYYSVNPEYGTMDDFKNFLNEAHKRGIKVIIDLVLNHTSNQHPWFLNAADPTSPYHDWYIWSDTDPGYVGSWGQKIWFEQGDEYYYSTFSEFMPDLNYTNPEVTQEMQNIVQFWVNEVGVDGFRLDAAKHLIEEGIQQANTISTHSWYEKFRPALKQINPHALTVGEIWEDTRINAEYLQGDEGDPVTDYRLSLEASNLPGGNYVPAPILGGGDFMPLEINSNGGFSRYTPILEVPPYAIITLGF
ncbi:MAG TPA: alpha-amylase family glycosyl hydrolase [Anaerolineaceae bacterium]|nr:alpha-amylase family glycosyl hydrolase [Anaerolineaceae bacterium]